MLAASVVLLMLVGPLVGCKSADIASAQQTDVPKLDASFSASVHSNLNYEAAKSSGRTLFINGATGAVSLRDDATGAAWRSNPDESAQPDMTGQNVDLIRSQFSLTYYRIDDGLSVTQTSYLDSVMKSRSQVEYYPVQNGIGVRYLVGDKPIRVLYPSVISEERFRQYLSRMSEDAQVTVNFSYSRLDLKDYTADADRQMLLQNFPQLRNHPVYVLGGNGVGSIRPDSLISQEIEEAFSGAGYTRGDLDKDNAENNVKVAEQKDYSIYISLEYTLRDGELTVRIPRESIVYDTSRLVLTQISLLPYFGAAGTQDTGYIFVPDGSGALIHLNNNKHNTPFFQKDFYSRDRSVSEMKQTDTDDYSMNLPVYGIKTEDRAFLGVIEKSDAVASLTADVSGAASKFNVVYPTFTLKQRHVVTSSVLNLSGNVTYQKAPVSSDIQIKYLFLTGGSADYVGMARAYQDDLLKSGALPVRAAEKELPMYVDVVGSVPYKTTRLGVPVETDKALTGYTQAVEILRALQKAGVQNLKLGYTGWMNHGVYNSISDSVALTNVLGGNEGFRQLTEFLSKENIPFYPNAELAYVYKDTWTDGFHEKRDSSRDLEKNIARDGAYNIVTYTDLYESFRWVVSPSQYGRIADGLMGSLKKLSLMGVDLTSFSTDINSDFSEDRLYDRSSAKNAIQEQYRKFSDAGFGIAVDSANAYAWAQASVAVGCPQSASFQYIEDESVPFYQIVLQGCLPYTSEAINLSDDYRRSALRAVETGAMPFYCLIYEPNATLMGTDYDLYSACYEQWLDDASRLYMRAKDAWAAVAGSKIAGRKQLSEGVYATTYENGTVIYVNYSDNAFAFGKVDVGAMDFVVAKGGGGV